MARRKLLLRRLSQLMLQQDARSDFARKRMIYRSQFFGCILHFLFNCLASFQGIFHDRRGDVLCNSLFERHIHRR